MIDTRFDQIALQHGVIPGDVCPLSKSRRLEKLQRTLMRTDVPFPIEPASAAEYFQLAQQGIPFKVGTLSHLTVDLAGFENEQVYESLTIEDHLSWACLIADQQTTKHKYACDEYLRGEAMFEIGGSTIPDYYVLNARIYQQTGWQLATVSEIIPAHVFFHCHSRRFFPVTTFMRPIGTDYLQEPDIGHDIAGHVATFTIPEVALVMNYHGLANDIIHEEKERQLAKAQSEQEAQLIRDYTTELLLYAGRIYWFTVEFGLVAQANGLKAFGAGILSSPGETEFSIESPESNRILVDVSKDRDLVRLATTDYLISEYQKTYFVLKDFGSLETLTPERIVAVAKMASRLPHHTWKEVVPGDEVLHVGKCMRSPNEKYDRLLSGLAIDECLQRTAIRNLRMLEQGIDASQPMEDQYLEALPKVSESVVNEFSARDRQGDYDCVLPREGTTFEAEVQNSLNLGELISRLSAAGPAISVETLKSLLNNTEFTSQELEPFWQFDGTTYQRNLVVREENFEMLVLCFEAGQRTPVHDHAGSACGVKILEGTATETSFEMNRNGWLCAMESHELAEGGVVASVDMDIHQLANLQPAQEKLVTLHVYSPPLGEVGNYSLIDNKVTRVKAASHDKGSRKKCNGCCSQGMGCKPKGKSDVE